MTYSSNYYKTPVFFFLSLLLGLLSCKQSQETSSPRKKISINEGWKFYKYSSDPDDLIYDVRPEIERFDDSKDADTKPTEAEEVEATQRVLKAYILPTGNAFLSDPSSHYERPEGNPGADFPFVQKDFDDSSWETLGLPHDWAIEGPFLEGWDAEVGGGMGRLPSHGVGWYRRKLDIPAADEGKSIFLDVDGAMSYAMVWINGHLAGGWPYGYNSWRIDLTLHLNYGGDNQLAIRIDNPNHSSRWYPGGGIYRNVWLTKTSPVHVAHWGTYITTPEVSTEEAHIHLQVTIDNDDDMPADLIIQTNIHEVDAMGYRKSAVVSSFPEKEVALMANASLTTDLMVTLRNPRLWGPPPGQQPYLYEAVTQLMKDGGVVDEYSTRFGIRDIDIDSEKGVIVNGEPIRIQGVNQHHDLGALGAAWNDRAAERQLEILKDLGCNAIRMAHNPPAPELLDLTDRMGFLVVDEVFDSWERKKTPHDFHLIFSDWYEQDTRSFIRRDRNHPSIIMWSYGNEVGEQYTDELGADLSRRIRDIVKDEDLTRPTTLSMNYAKPWMPFPAVPDVINLNYQGEGIRDAPAYAHLRGIKTSPLYPDFHEAFPDKLIISSETAAAVSSRGTYLFPVTEGISAPVSDGVGGDETSGYVSAYELYTAPFGSSADKVFASQDQHPYVGGEFVWSGFDYLGEPTPFYLARSSFFGIIDLAGFKKDRAYLYQARWKPDEPLIHILPHWNWPDRVGQVTPVHVITTEDEAELFLNGKSLGRKKKGAYEYRLRWDDVVYQPGELKVVAYKGGRPWAEKTEVTTGPVAKLELISDRKTVAADGRDLVFITATVHDVDGYLIRNADNPLTFMVEGPGEIVATDNGDPTDMTAFPSHKRNAFSGKALVIVKARKGEAGEIIVKVTSDGLEEGEVKLIAK